MKRLIFLLGFLLLFVACDASEPLTAPADAFELFRTDLLRFDLIREGERYDLEATCIGEGSFTEILLDVETTNSFNNSSMRVEETADSDSCTPEMGTILTNSLFTITELVPDETFDICVTVTRADGASQRCRPVVVRADGYLELQENG